MNMAGMGKRLVVMAALGGFSVQAADFYVVPGGDDTRTGAKDQPLASLAAARDAARKAGAGPHRIVVLPGDYYLDESLLLDARDNGLTIEASVTNSVVVYGGRPVSGWRREMPNCVSITCGMSHWWGLPAMM